MEKEYALALNRALSNGTSEDTLVAALMQHLKTEGRTKLLPGIVRELKRLKVRTKQQGVTVEVASDAETASALAQAKTLGIDADTATVNPTLIRGWRARKGGMLVDRSAKQALVDLYQKITN